MTKYEDKLINFKFLNCNYSNMEIMMKLNLKFNSEFIISGINSLNKVNNEPKLNEYKMEINENNYIVTIRCLLRDIQINSGCSKSEFISGICLDPHILSIGGSKFDLPHDDNIYKLIEGLGLNINVKCQILNNNSYAKYFYVKYNNESIIIDIDDLELKKLGNKTQIKYGLLKSTNYLGNNFVLEKNINSLIMKSIDGLFELLFNSETRGLLLKSSLNFTQENSYGILASSNINLCRIDNINN